MIGQSFERECFKRPKLKEIDIITSWFQSEHNWTGLNETKKLDQALFKH